MGAKNKPVDTLLDKADVIDALTDMVEDSAYKVSRARSPKTKRHAMHTARFLNSVLHYVKNGGQDATE